MSPVSYIHLDVYKRQMQQHFVREPKNAAKSLNLP